MSIKIYNAFRVKNTDLIKTIDWTHDTLFGVAQDIIEKEGELITEKELEISPAFPEEKRKLCIRYKRTEIVLDKAKKDAISEHPLSTLDIDCGLNVWPGEDGFFYVIPICHRLFQDKLCERLPSWVEEFSYWDNTDQPEAIAHKEWEVRGKTWEEICCGESGRSQYNMRCMYHEVVNIKSGTGIFALLWEGGYRDLIHHQNSKEE